MSDRSPNPDNTPHSPGGGGAEDGSYAEIQARPKNWLVPVVLVILRESTTYGYELMNRAARLGFEAMNPGTLYRTLRKMEEDGLCQSEWDVASRGPARRMYSITAAGEAYLDSWVKSLEQYQHTLEAFSQAYSRGKASSEETGSETT